MRDLRSRHAGVPGPSSKVEGGRAKDEVHNFDDVVWDPGYSLCQPQTTTYPLAQAGIEQTLELVTRQRGVRPFRR